MKKIISIILALTIVCSISVFANPFNDVEGHWAKAEIEKGYANKVINGDGDGKFRPDDTITRGEFLKMIVALVCDKISSVNGETVTIPDEIGDGTHWASKYYNFSKITNLIPDFQEEVDGVYAGTMNSPEDYDKAITRWEMAYMLSNSMGILTGAANDTSDLSFADTAAIKSYPQAIVGTINHVVQLELMKGDEKNNFAPKASGTRAEAVTVINRMGDSIQKYIDMANNEAEAYYKSIEENRVTYDKIPTGHPKATIVMENGKKIELELYPEYAPQTVANFVKLAKDGFYNGTTFHRVVKDFMAQGGDPKGDGTGGSGKYIMGEFSSNSFDKNTLSHTKGVISMARSQHPDSASSQFFICLGDATNLDGDYAAFGKVIKGMDVVEAFAQVEMAMNNAGELAAPVEPIVIKSITVK